MVQTVSHPRGGPHETSSSPLQVIDIDDPDSWPEAVFDSVKAAADDLERTTEYFGDLDVSLDEEKSFLLLLDGYAVRAYHATRLLDHEVDEIRKGGLLPLSESLIDQRIKKAVAAGHLAPDVGDSLIEGNALRTRGLDKRADQICLFLSDFAMREEVSSIWPLLRIWGGEGINFTHAGKVHKEDLSIGRPAIVVSLLDLSNKRLQSRCHPKLKHLFVGKLLGFGNQGDSRFGADVFYYGAIPAQQIEDVLLPGTHPYDRYPELPRD